ncbi:hypothetical protein ACTMS0_10980 [Micromonospora sp. H33]|uniref:hypothetical protein n=1 Tax=Micromonospora sp. H33 TaxID=3452215 RepID=UPI003F897FB3
MAFRTWGKLLLTALGVSLLAGAGQLGIAFGLGVVRLTGVFTGGTVDQWPAQLAWVGWFAANAAVVGAVVTERLARRDGPLTGTGRQLGVAGAAALGATVVAPLCMQPARAADLISVDPVWAVAICTVLGAVVGAGAALAVLVRPPLGWNMALVAGAVWLLALVSVVPSLAATGPLTTARLGVLEPAWLNTAAAQRLAMVILPLVALLAGAATSALARWRGHPPLIGGLTGVAGPVLLAFAYLTAGPGGGVDRYQTTPYYGALLAVAAGALGSAAAALLRWPLVERPAAGNGDTPAAARAIEPTHILRPLPAGPPLPQTDGTTPSAGTAGDAGRPVDDTGTPAGGDAPDTRWGGRTPETPGGPTPAHWDWPTPGGTSAGASGAAVAAATAGLTGTPVSTPVDPEPLAGDIRTDRHRASAPVPASSVEVAGSDATSSGASKAEAADPTRSAAAAPAGPSARRTRAARPATLADGAARPAAPADDAAGPATPMAEAAKPAAPVAGAAKPATRAAGTAGPGTSEDGVARPGTPEDGVDGPSGSTDDAARSVVPARDPAQTTDRTKAADRVASAPADEPGAEPAGGGTAPRPRRARRTKAAPAKATGAASRTTDGPAAAATTAADRPKTAPSDAPPSVAGRARVLPAVSGPAPTDGSPAPDSVDAGWSDPAPAAARAPVPSEPLPAPPPTTPARPAPTQVGPDPFTSSRPAPTPVTPPRPTPTPVGPEPFAALPPLTPAQPAPRPVAPDPFTPPARGSARPGDDGTAEVIPRPRHRAPLPDLNSANTWDALATARRAGPTESRPTESRPTSGTASTAEGPMTAGTASGHALAGDSVTGGDATPGDTTGPTPADTTGPTPADATRPTPGDTTGPTPADATRPTPGDATGPTPGDATGPVPVSTTAGGDSSPSVADRPAAAFAGADGRAAGGPSSPSAGQVAGDSASASHGGSEERPEPKRRGLFRRNRSRADQADASADAEPLPAQDEEFVDWVTGLSKPLPDNEPEQETARRSLRSTGRHHRD